MQSHTWSHIHLEDKQSFFFNSPPSLCIRTAFLHISQLKSSFREKRNPPRCAAGLGGRRGWCCSSWSPAFCCHQRSDAGRESPGPWLGKGTGCQTQSPSFQSHCSGSSRLLAGVPLVNPCACNGLAKTGKASHEQTATAVQMLFVSHLFESE